MTPPAMKRSEMDVMLTREAMLLLYPIDLMRRPTPPIRIGPKTAANLPIML